MRKDDVENLLPLSSLPGLAVPDMEERLFRTRISDMHRTVYRRFGIQTYGKECPFVSVNVPVNVNGA
jgi:hypothetical protein